MHNSRQEVDNSFGRCTDIGPAPTGWKKTKTHSRALVSFANRKSLPVYCCFEFLSEGSTLTHQKRLDTDNLEITSTMVRCYSSHDNNVADLALRVRRTAGEFASAAQTLVHKSFCDTRKLSFTFQPAHLSFCHHTAEYATKGAWEQPTTNSEPMHDTFHHARDNSKPT